MGILRVGLVVGVLALTAGCVKQVTVTVPEQAVPASTPAPAVKPSAAKPSAAKPSTVKPSVVEPSVVAPSAGGKPVRTGPGIYTFSYEGAVGIIQVPANIMDPRLERYGDYRRLVGAKPITYLIAQVTNRSDDIITMSEVVVVTANGQQVEAAPISDYLEDWAGEADVENFPQGLRLANDSRFFLHPGAKGTAFLGAKEPITSVARVFVYPVGPFSRVEAHRTR